jgi:uncharacterized small protein (DUF1192 family)
MRQFAYLRDGAQVAARTKGRRVMAFEDDVFGAPRKPPVAHEIGQSIDTLSVHELEERIALLREEILRLEAAIKARQATKDAASAFFKS